MGLLYQLRGIICYHQTHLALDLPELDLERGVLYAVTGANGAGKSTLLNLLAFLSVPGAGTVRFAGETVTPGGMAALRRRVTLLAQAPYLLRGTVADNLDYGLRIRGIPRHIRQDQARAALAEVGLDGFAARSARALSGGEQQRVALARALVLQPEVLLLDEPCAGLDRDSVARIEAVLRDLVERGTSVILATHDARQGERLGARMLSLCSGRLVSPGRTTSIIPREQVSWPSVLTTQEAGF